MESKLVEIKPIKKVSIPATLLLIPPGHSAEFSCREFARLNSVQAAISRLNRNGESFFIEPHGNGESFIISRK